MAVAIPVLAGIGGGAAAAALGAGTALSIGTGLATGVATASLMNRSRSGGAPAPAAPVVEAPTTEAPTPPAPPPPPPSVDVSPGGAIRNVEAIQGERDGDTRVPGTGAGRQSTILTTPRGIMGEEGTRPGRTLSGGLLRPQRGMSAGLIS
jgi:hypothetical protein